MIMQHIKTFLTPQRTSIIYIAAATLTLLPFMTAPVSLLMGLALAQLAGNPFEAVTRKATGWLLKCAVIGLGFGMNAVSALKAGQEGFVFAAATIVLTLTAGALLGKWLKVEKVTSHLVASGTAICGGSAIAAIAPVMRAGTREISVSLGIVFLLNAAALFIFPVAGHWLHLTQHQFGMWSAIAIHDTSAVVGAAGKYGEEALQIATTVKLSRALWIIPASLVTALLFKTGSNRIKVPWFIGLFIIAMCINTWVPAIHPFTPYVLTASKAALSLTLFFIGTQLTRQSLSGIGWKPLLLGILLWALISIASLSVIILLG